jgi:hypothetical protein
MMMPAIAPPDMPLSEEESAEVEPEVAEMEEAVVVVESPVDLGAYAPLGN